MAVCAHADFILRSTWVVEGLQEDDDEEKECWLYCCLRHRSVSKRKTRQHMKKAC